MWCSLLGVQRALGVREDEHAGMLPSVFSDELGILLPYGVPIGNPLGNAIFQGGVPRAHLRIRGKGKNLCRKKADNPCKSTENSDILVPAECYIDKSTGVKSKVGGGKGNK